MSIVHCLTIFRLVVGPLFLLVYLEYQFVGLTATTLPLLLIVFLGLSELSDALDGYLARKYNQVSDIGKILDPMADSISRLSFFFAFTQPPVSIPLLFAFIIFFRDSIVSTLRTICALKGHALAARPSGKVKAALQAMAAISILLLMVLQANGIIDLTSLQHYAALIAGAVSFYTLMTGVEYLLANRHFITNLSLPENG